MTSAQLRENDLAAGEPAGRHSKACQQGNLPFDVICAQHNSIHGSVCGCCCVPHHFRSTSPANNLENEIVVPALQVAFVLEKKVLPTKVSVTENTETF